MSFFHEPPPLDTDVPPPLDDKPRDNYYDLDDEETIIEDSRIDLPELPTDFNVFSSVATDGDVSYSHPPPELESYIIHSTPPPDDHHEVDQVLNESPVTCDVAKEKESYKIDEVSQQQAADTSEADGDKEVGETITFKQTNLIDGPIATDDVIEVKMLNSAAVLEASNENIPLERAVAAAETLPSEETEETDEMNIEEATTVQIEDGANDVKIEYATALMHEEILGKVSELDIYTGFTIQDDIPEPIPELNLEEDDDDDFNDFETAIPVNRIVEQVKICAIESEVEEAPAEIQFVADFSAFDEPSESTFEEFQDFKASGFSSSTKDLENQLQDDDDDDFGDFNDFTQAPAPVTIQPDPIELHPVAFVKPANVNGIIDMMFPPTSSCSEGKIEGFECDNVKDQQVIKSDNFVNKFNDFDSTLALRYLYNSSKASQSLVKALGIDTRNILLGPQWGSSSSAPSNMPRFAANLSFSPIEPIKPSPSQSSSAKSSTEPQPSILQPSKAPTEIVPEVEFDWNSSGLTNPLDGPQPKPQQPHDVESIIVQQPPAHPLENESSLYVVDQEVTQVFETEAKANASHKSELSEPSAYQWSSEIGIGQHHVGHFSSTTASTNVLVRERTIKLPETHIFTPVKGTSPVAREVISRDVSPAPDFLKGSITVKEYHDVEYSLEPKKRIESEGDFDDFQSAAPPITKSDPPLVPLNLLEPKIIATSSTEIKWPDPGNNSMAVVNDLDFLEAPVAPKPSFNLPLAASAPVSKKKEQAFARPVIGTSPTEQNGSTEDDDFNDFQAAPPRTQAARQLQSNDPITLSPARLVASVGQQSNQKPGTWISSLDNDEITRIEAAFPKCKTEKKSPQKTNDDEDDWSDFVGATQPNSLPFSQSQLPSTISSNSMENSKYSNGDADDWSDFVSVPPPVSRMPTAKSSGAISSQFQSKPNFSSWNQPIAKPYVNHTTSFLTNSSGSQSQQFTSTNYPYVTDKMNITNNFNYNFNHPELYHGMGSSSSRQQQQQKPNGVSTILPELDFAMPKNLINLPRGGQLDPGKK